MKFLNLILCLFVMCSFSQMTFAAEKLATTQSSSEKSATAQNLEEKSATVQTAEKVIDPKESEIALNLDGPKKSDSQDHPLLKMILTLSVLCFLMGGAYFFIRRQESRRRDKAVTQIKVLTQHYLGPKKSLAIVRVAGESILIGVTDHNISMIKSLSLLDEDIPQETPVQFATELKNAEMTEDEEFSIHKVKDAVSNRLRNMRSL